MANNNKKQPRQNNSLSWWWDKTPRPSKPFKSWKEISFELSLLDYTGLGLLIHLLFTYAASYFHDIILNNNFQWTPLARILTAPVFAALALPLELWNALGWLVACVATPLLWAGERMVNAVLDVFEPLKTYVHTHLRSGIMANKNTQKQSRKNTSLRDWFEWTNPSIPFTKDNENHLFSLLDRTGLGLLIHSALATVANPFWELTWNNEKKWTPLARILTAPVFAALALPLELWNALDLLVACVATPLLWAGERLMNAVLDVFEPLKTYVHTHLRSGTMANKNTQKQSRKNTSLIDWFEWTNPSIPFTKDNENHLFSLLDRTRLGLLIHSALATVANPFWELTWNNEKKWTPLARILTAPVFAALALPLELWNALDLLVACVATPLLWAGERMVNAVLDVFKPKYDNDGSDLDDGPSYESDSCSDDLTSVPQATLFSETPIAESRASSEGTPLQPTARPA